MQLSDKSKTGLPAEVRYPISVQGAGAGAPTIASGQGWSIVHPGVGRIQLKLANAKDNPGSFIGLAGKPALRDATQANVKNMDVTAGTWDAANQLLELNVWSSAGAAADLAATSLLDVTLVFSQLSSTKR